jgi:hypothetical protein
VSFHNQRPGPRRGVNPIVNSVESIARESPEGASVNSQGCKPPGHAGGEADKALEGRQKHGGNGCVISIRTENTAATCASDLHGSACHPTNYRRFAAWAICLGPMSRGLHPWLLTGAAPRLKATLTSTAPSPKGRQ